jgi:hypothetical protein
VSGENLLTFGGIMNITLKQQHALLGLIVSLFLSLPVAQQAHSGARATFEFTCETSEDDFYDWIEAELWPKSSAAFGSSIFGRNLDAVFDILTDENTRRSNWEITLTTIDCQTDPATDLRRESLFETIEDAHADGHGLVLRRR